MAASILRTSALIAPLALVALTGSPARADITGRVEHVGAPPRVRPVNVSSDPACRPYAAEATKQALRVHDGRVADVFVYLVRVEAPKAPPPPPARLVARHCHLEPRVIGIQVGQKLVVENEDGTLYSVRVRGGGTEAGRRLPKVGSRLTHRFTAPQVMARVSCDVHTWLAAHVGVLEHPFFAVSDAQGSFRIPTEGLADGGYELRAWHELLGERTATVTVKGGEASVTVRFGE